MFFIIYYMCWVLPLFASRTYRGADNWENAINSCNLKIFSADNCNGEHSSKIWQPFVQIMTYPIITKGCHNLTSQIIKSSTVMEKNNITNCYHFCWFNQTNREANIKTLLMKGNSCSCLNKSLEDTIPKGDTSYTAVKCQGDNSSYAVYEIDVSYNFTANQIAGCGSVQPSVKKATFSNCSEQKGAYCTGLSNTDGIRLNQKEKMTGDDFKIECEGHLTSLNEIKDININPDSSATIFPSSRFWVGHRIWSYINYQFDPELLTTSIKCGYYDPELGNVEFGSCLENNFYECHEKAKMLRATKSKRKSTSPYAASSPATSRLGRHRTSVAPSTLPPQSATTEQPPALLQGDPSALAQGNVLLQIRRNNFPPAVLVPSSLTSVQPLSASGTFSGSGNWENASNSCNLTIFNADNSNEKYSSKIWQPFVQIMTLPLITKGCHMLTSQIIKSSTVMEKNNITNCYHFCWFNQNNRETKIKTLLIKENNCSCLNKSLEDAIPQRDTFFTAVECPGDNSSYAVYEIDVSYNFTAKQTAGCGSVQPSEKIATFTNCSEKKGAYCTPLSNSDPTRLNEKENMSWDDFKMKCEGRLASLNEIKNINSESSNTIVPSSRFWVGHRIWSYINYQFDPELLTTSIKCGYYDPELGNVEFGSCLENNFYECHEKDAIRKTKGETTQEMQAPNQITNIVIGGIAGTATVLLILLVIIYIKRKRARHIQPKPEPNEHQLIEKPKQPVYDETHLENDYDHLHEHQDTHNVGDVNVYDVSKSCADVTNIGSDVYNTSKDFDCDKTYDYSTHNNLGKVDNSILNNDQYGTIPAGT